MAAKEIHFHQGARERILRGVQTLSDAVTVTLGFSQLIRQLAAIDARASGADLNGGAGSRRCSEVLIGRQKRALDYGEHLWGALQGVKCSEAHND